MGCGTARAEFNTWTSKKKIFSTFWEHKLIINKKILFAILAGGQSKRFEVDLKLLQINGITILDK